MIVFRADFVRQSSIILSFLGSQIYLEYTCIFGHKSFLNSIDLLTKYLKFQDAIEPSSENLMYESPCFLQETQNNVEKP